MRSHRLEFLICLFLAVVTLAVYWQLLSHDFIGFDDGVYVSKNPHVQAGLTKQNVLWAFTNLDANFWHPLTWLSHMLDVHLFGLKPGMHHLTNLLFHVVNSILLFLTFRRMTGAIWRSAFVAALFALHPLHVESVAWIAERKDVLSTFFWMLAMWAYAGYAKRPGLGGYLLVLVFFVLGLMSKPMVVTLPFVLLLMDFWPLGRLRLWQSEKEGTSRDLKPSISRLLLEKAPFLAFTGIAVALAYSAQGQAIASLNEFPLEIRIANALVSYVTYIGKMFWPSHLAIFYPHSGTVPMWESAGAGLLLVVLTVLSFKALRSRPYLAVGWLWYLGTLIPVIGLVQVGSHAMADRYTYVPLIGLFMMVGWSVPAFSKGQRYGRIGFALLTGALIGTIMICTWLQVRHWKNNMTIFTYTANVTENNWLAHTNLGAILGGQRRYGEAIRHFREALRMRPNDVKAHNNLGNAFAEQGRYRDAIRHYSEALRLDSDERETHENLGVLLLKQGKNKEAIKHFSEAARIKPDWVEPHYNLGVAKARQGSFEEAIRHYSEAIRFEPGFAEAHSKMADALLSLGRVESAIRHYLSAISIKPDYANAHSNLGVALARQGKINEAISQFERALEINPDDARVRRNLDRALEQLTQSLRLKKSNKK